MSFIRFSSLKQKVQEDEGWFHSIKAKLFYPRTKLGRYITWKDFDIGNFLSPQSRKAFLVWPARWTNETIKQPKRCKIHIRYSDCPNRMHGKFIPSLTKFKMILPFYHQTSKNWGCVIFFFSAAFPIFWNGRSYRYPKWV